MPPPVLLLRGHNPSRSRSVRVGGATETRKIGPLLLVSGGSESRIAFTRVARRWRNVKLVIANGGKAGLEMARVWRPRLVVLDAQLPDADSARTVSALVGYRAKVIVLGVDASGREMDRFTQAGAIGYLLKPLDVAQVDRIVLGLLEVVAVR